MLIKTVNAKGLREIGHFLACHHKRGDKITDEMLNEWACMAEFQLDQNNPPCIEIRSFDSLSGQTVEFTLSLDCVTVSNFSDG